MNSVSHRKRGSFVVAAIGTDLIRSALGDPSLLGRAGSDAPTQRELVEQDDVADEPPVTAEPAPIVGINSRPVK